MKSDSRQADTANSSIKTLSQLSERSQSMFFISSLTDYSSVEKILWMWLAFCKYIETCFVWCKRKKWALWKSIRSSRVRCTKYASIFWSLFLLISSRWDSDWSSNTDYEWRRRRNQSCVSKMSLNFSRHCISSLR